MKTQMELSLQGKRNVRTAARRRMPTARWWFQRMHDVVNEAFDWTSPVVRPQQIYMELQPVKNGQIRRGTRGGKQWE